MRTNLRTLTLTLLLSLAGIPVGYSQSTAFTYQGRLDDNARPAEGTYDLRFAVYDGATSGSVVAGAITNFATAVKAGLFTVTLDFGPGVFNGAPRWLDIAVRTNGGGTFAPLIPRQAIASAPYTIRSGTAGALDGVLPGAQLVGTYGNAVTFSNAANRFGGAFDGNGGGLTNVNAATLGGLGSGAFWQRTGNMGTTPGTDFLGTTDNQPLELKVHNQVALRLEPADGETANLVGGSHLNAIADGVRGSVIAGGGTMLSNAIPAPNRIEGNYAFLGGGYSNRISADRAIIGGGRQNTIETIASHAVVAGGSYNSVLENAFGGAIGGGYYNEISTNSYNAVIAGGANNRLGTNAAFSAVGGGWYNQIGRESWSATIGGGYTNTIGPNAAFATIPGGYQNFVGGFSSLAAGTRARALNIGAFVWSDTSGTGFTSTAANEFAVRATGGVRFETAGAGMTLDGQPVLIGTVTSAGIADAAVTTSKLANGAVGSAQLADNSVTTAKILDGTILNADISASAAIADTKLATIATAGKVANSALSASVSLLGQTIESAEITDGTIAAADVNAGSFNTTFWGAEGNGGTTPGTHFLGTTDNQPLELKVSGMRGMRLEPAGSSHVNLIGGSPYNYVEVGVKGATISGGGWYLAEGRTENYIGSDYGTVGGGYGNRIEPGSSIATIAGGIYNMVWTNSFGSTVGGGYRNLIRYDSRYSTIAGGFSNIILTNGRNSTISGGIDNEIGEDARESTIGGGASNVVNGAGSVIAGGTGNSVAAPRSFVGGGYANLIDEGSDFTTVSGGSENRVDINGDYSVIGGGVLNGIGEAAEFSTIAGGQSNRILQSVWGGTIGGGASNVISGFHGTVPGGARNQAAGSTSFAAGNRAKANHNGSFVWSDSQNADFASTANNQFLVRAAGGMGINKNNPETALDVGGTATFQSGSSGNNDNLALKKTGTVSASNVRFVMSHRSGGTQVYFYGYDGTTYRNLQGWDHANNAVRFPANGETLYVDQANARVGVKTAVPGFDLHVNGSAGKPGGGSWSVASDERLKKNVHPLESALDRLLQLRGVNFEYKDPQAVHELPGERMGMIAQEVEAVFPDWVETGVDGMKRMTVRGFEALAVEAVRQLRKEKDAEIEALKGEMKDLKQLVLSLTQSQKGATE